MFPWIQNGSVIYWVGDRFSSARFCSMCGEELYTQNTHIQADTQGETGSSGEKQLNQGQSWKRMTTSQS